MASVCHIYTKKKSQGRTYWYLRETVREGNKVRVKWQKYLGTPETLLAKLEKAEIERTPLRIRAEEFGSIFIANESRKNFEHHWHYRRSHSKKQSRKGSFCW